MYARIATFESDPGQIDEAIRMVRSEVESAQTPAAVRRLWNRPEECCAATRKVRYVRVRASTCGPGSG